MTYLTRQDDSPLGHLERCFFGHDAAWEGETDAVALYQAATAYTEVEYVSAQIRRLAQQGYRYRDMAVDAGRLRPAAGVHLPAGRHPRLRQPPQ